MTVEAVSNNCAVRCVEQQAENRKTMINGKYMYFIQLEQGLLEKYNWMPVPSIDVCLYWINFFPRI